MKQMHRRSLVLLPGALASGLAKVLRAQTTDIKSYTDLEKETFLRLASIVAVEEIGHGVTKPVRATMELRGVRHAGQVQVVNKDLPDYFPQKGAPVPMKDSWRYNIAAYKIDRLLGLGMATVAVQRAYQGKAAAFSWWVDDVMFEEVDRVKKRIEPPDPEDFERQRAVSRVFDELIFNIDRNLSNLLITKSWRLSLIDHSRCFTPYPGIRNLENLTRCSRPLLASMKRLDSNRITAAVQKLLASAEISALLARRDKIVAHFEHAAREKGESSVLFG